MKNDISSGTIAEEIESMPSSYNTVLGEKGRLLSGGQRQRLLIARAIYKKPQYLFMDEATNALDTLNEQKIVNALENIFKDKTVIVVAHRLSTIQKADQIVVMHNWRITEIGNHDSLLKKNGRYAKLLESQLPVNVNLKGTDNNSSRELYDLI